MRSPARLLSVLIVALVGSAQLLGLQKPIVTYKAQAVDLNQPAGRTTGEVNIVVTRWSSGPERGKLRKAVDQQESGAKLLEVLSQMKPVGSMRTPDGVDYTLRYAQRTSDAGVGYEQVVLVTDRPLAFWERQNIAKTTNYPFSVVELRTGSNGEGDGKLSLVSKIAINDITDRVELDNYEITPVLLQHVQRDTP